MMRRALWIGGATLAMTACGPMPGYVAPSERHQPDKSRSSVAYSAPGDEAKSDDHSDEGRNDDERYASDEPRVRTPRTPPRTVLREHTPPEVPTPPTSPAPPTPPAPPTVSAETSPPASPTPASSKLQVVPLDRADTYYLIDRERGVCFFIHKETSAKIDCAIIPEGRDVVTSTPAPAPASPAKSDEGVRRRYVEPVPAPAPAEPARRATPAPPTPAPAADPASPTAEELNRFEGAYVEIACDRRQGSFTPPRERVEQSGLTIDRYNAIESWLTSDERSWRLLVNRAYRECDARK